MQHYRGSSIRIAATFTDSDGNATDPSGAVLALRYMGLDGRWATQSVALTKDNILNAWVYYWDSSIANPGNVYLSVRTTDASARVIDYDAQFQLHANSANVAA